MAATRLGTSTTARSSGVWLTGSQGASLVAATTIAITDSVHEITGSTTINTINGGQSNMGLILYKPTGATWVLGSGGNIKASTGTPATERAIFLWTPDGTTWYAGDNSTSVAAGSTKVSVAESVGTYTIDVVEANLNMNNSGTTLAIAHGGTGQTTKAAAFDALSPTTTRGDLIVRNATVNTSLATGAAGTVLSGGTDPAWTANPTVTSVTVADANNGMVSIGSNNIGWKINSTNELSLTATALAPVTNLGLSAGDASHFFDRAYMQDASGWRLATLTTSSGGDNIVASFPVAASTGVAFIVDYAVFVAGSSSNFSTGIGRYAVVTVAKGTAVTGATSAAVGNVNVNSDGSVFAITAGPVSVDSAANNVARLHIASPTLGGSGGVASSVLCQYKLTFLYGDPVITELL